MIVFILILFTENNIFVFLHKQKKKKKNLSQIHEPQACFLTSFLKTAWIVCFSLLFPS